MVRHPLPMPRLPPPPALPMVNPAIDGCGGCKSPGPVVGADDDEGDGGVEFAFPEEEDDDGATGADIEEFATPVLFAVLGPTTVKS